MTTVGIAFVLVGIFTNNVGIAIIGLAFVWIGFASE